MPNQTNVKTIAIDGPAGSGKGTVARRLAAWLDYAYLDTGKLYRSFAYFAEKTNKEYTPEDIMRKFLSDAGEDLFSNPILTTEKIGLLTANYAKEQWVRNGLLDYQRHFALHPPSNRKGAILDGRDIGTVILPDADIKIYITASKEERARRRLIEMQASGHDDSFESILANITQRDFRDMNRKHAPLRPAKNAHLLDTTNLSIDAAFEVAMSIIDAALR